MASRLINSAEVFSALAHPARLRILGMLRGGSLCVCQITAVLELAASTVSAHLADLRRAGLVLERKEGRWVKYSLADAREPKAVFELVRSLFGDDPRIQDDARLVRGLRRVPVEELCRVGLDVTRLGLTRAPG
jgi:DNA-binding transcriptional ArsR family regulator